ncbi:MAG: DUF5011 domain-containing protein [Candidatus Kaiserbacteria bacterium]|nr:MAG: DUF5011 domain-containing protein [Candidatus Kaiserbacteria bacterium]
MSFWHFLQYHNAVPIAIGILVLGAGGVFAATNPEAIYSASETVVSVDNTYISGKDFTSWSPKVQIVEVTEDQDNYYVKYQFRTIALQDYVWRDVIVEETMNVSKADLGPYRDLGLYAMAQLKQKIDREISFLKEVQAIERKSITQKTVATTYGGLVGALLDDSSEVIPGYQPVVTPPAPIASTSSDASSGSASSGDSGGGSVSTAPASGGTINVQVLGKNPARIEKGYRYADLGAFATGADGQSILIDLYLNDIHTPAISIDTSAPGTWTVRYEASDSSGNRGTATRIVEIYDPYAPIVQETASSTPSAEPEPEPQPESETTDTATSTTSE